MAMLRRAITLAALSGAICLSASGCASASPPHQAATPTRAVTPTPPLVAPKPSPFDWATVVSAVLAGGIVGQVITLFGADRLTERREYRRWLASERHKAFAELLGFLGRTPVLPDELMGWTYQIRDASQRIHILFEGGTAPTSLADALEATFKLAQAKKDGSHSHDWADRMRNAVRELRLAMAVNLKP